MAIIVTPSVSTESSLTIDAMMDESMDKRRKNTNVFEIFNPPITQPNPNGTANGIGVGV
jgi:hypothetical protein